MMRSAHDNDEESAEARVLQCLFADRETGERWKFRDSQDRANSWPIELNRRKVIRTYILHTYRPANGLPNDIFHDKRKVQVVCLETQRVTGLGRMNETDEYTR